MHTTDQYRSKMSTNESEINATHSSRDNRQNGTANVAQMDNSSSGLRLITPLYKITGPRALNIHKLHHQKKQNGTTKVSEDLLSRGVHTEYMDFPRMYTKNTLRPKLSKKRRNRYQPVFIQCLQTKYIKKDNYKTTPTTPC